LRFHDSFRFAARPTSSAAGRTIGTFASSAVFAVNVVERERSTRANLDTVSRE
jgi:hypothetical protein